MLKEIYEQPRAVRDTMLGPRGPGNRPHLPGRNGYRAGRIRAVPSGAHHRLRHQLARRPGRQVHDREAGAHPGGSGLRQRVPLSRPDRAAGYAHGGDLAVRRNRRYAGGAARGQAERLEDAGHLQRGRLHDHARGRRHHLHPRGAGDRRGLHQGLHLPVDRAVHPGHVPGPGATSISTRAPVARPGAGVAAHSRQARNGALQRRHLRSNWRATSTTPPTPSISAAAFTSPSRSKARSS